MTEVTKTDEFALVRARDDAFPHPLAVFVKPSQTTFALYYELRIIYDRYMAHLANEKADELKIACEDVGAFIPRGAEGNGG